MKTLIIVVCIGLIALGLFLFLRSIFKLAKGRCCEGCTGCSHQDSCSAKDKAAAEQSIKDKADKKQ